jgi:hypothetical protein
MATSDLKRVLTVFRGIGDRDPELAIKRMHPTKHTQHNPHACGGIDRVKEWIAQLPREKCPPETIRAFQDGSTSSLLICSHFHTSKVISNIPRPACITAPSF